MEWKNKAVEWKSIPLVYEGRNAGRFAPRVKSQE
jgi:hypothetical protein